MCDYSLHLTPSRPAESGDKLITTTFPTSRTRGFAAVGEPNVAVCLLPGTEIRFENEVKYHRAFGLLPKMHIRGLPGFVKSTGTGPMSIMIPCSFRADTSSLFIGSVQVSVLRSCSCRRQFRALAKRTSSGRPLRGSINDGRVVAPVRPACQLPGASEASYHHLDPIEMA